MGRTGFDLFAHGIDAELDHLHKQRRNARAAELHAAADLVEGEAGEQARRELRDYHNDRFRPDTRRMALLDQAAANYLEREHGAPLPL